ncbi:phage tail sheath subtilisin-like domain-containing protein [Pseudanabaena sp. FACHB-2040]|uniref:phage tail sheath family protein n=1 Tax=Pseudanabaena sp. FACHB-2040 TaxID=2692859 RepID=UPI001687C133|nr:phage tail sheath subtilisin-like domain-containing protein [Pseudanabaena sp. FACHB-2040]MBD2261372.1 phage tail sheath subtilisin-like domain-containing protein [Pseudanabaena sp. FACHB-2040]
MVTGFSHGVFTRYVDTVPRPVTVVPSAVIAIVGTAPTYRLAAVDRHLNDPVRVINDVDDAQFGGPKSMGFTIPYALDALRDNGAGTVEIVNVFNANVHKTTAQAVSHTFATTGAMADKLQLQQVTGTAPTQTVVSGTKAEGLTDTFTLTNQAGGTTYAAGTDYTYDAITGIVSRVSGGTIPSGSQVKVTYTYADPSKATSTDVVGAVTNGDRTGLQALKDIYNLRGYRPKIIICPGFSDLTTVAAEMGAIANDLEAYYILDSAVGLTRDEAVAGRAGTSPAANFGTASRRAILAYPRVYDTQEVPQLQPYSQYLAGVMANTDAELGYWWSPSNKPIQGITGVERRLTADFTDPNTDVTALNAAGVTTIYNNFGSGFLVWGNRSALYPSDTTPLNFIAVGRTLDIFHESLQRASLPFVDRPINNALIDAIVETGNGFIREQVILGALLEGSKLFYDKAKNPPTSLAAGRIVFSISMMIPTPAETIIFETTLDINLLGNLGGNS